MKTRETHVTGILKNCGFGSGWFDKLSKEDREFYLQRGRMIHKATELYDKDVLNINTIDLRIKPYVNAWIKFRVEIGGEIIAIEKRVKNGKYGYVGRLDRIIKNCSLYSVGSVVFDIKTTEADIYTRLQTMGYKLSTRYKNLKRGYVALKVNGNYNVGIYQDDASDQVAWIACVRLNNWIVRNKK